MKTLELQTPALQESEWSENSVETNQKFVTFTLGPGYFAVPIAEVQEIVYGKRITALPAAAPYMAGVIELRGDVISVVNLKKRLNLPGSLSAGNAFVVLRQADTLYALQVDTIAEVEDVTADHIEPLPAAVHRGDEEILTKVIKSRNRLITIIDPEKIFTKNTLINEEPSMANTIYASQRGNATQTVTETIQLVTFSIENDEYAVNIKDVQEINKIAAITHVPRAPRFVEGVINLRGQVLPVINLRERFGISKIGYDKNTRVIVIQLQDKRLGLIVDAVSEVLRIPSPAVKLPPAEAIGENADFVSGIAEWNQRLIIVLNLESVLSHEEVHDLSAVKEIIEENLTTDPSNN